MSRGSQSSPSEPELAALWRELSPSGSLGEAAGGRSQPHFSIVVPTYNRRAFLREAIASVQEQTVSSWELLIVDDGSDDRTVELCQAVDDRRVRVVPLRHTGIVGHVRNEGARLAAGRYLAFLDSDDLWRPAKLERQRAALERSGAEWSYTGFQLVGERGACVETCVPSAKAGSPDELLTGLLTTEVAAAMSSLVVSRAAFARAGGFSTHPRIREDHDLVIRLAEAAEPRVEVPEVLVTMRQHDGRSDFGESDPFSRSAVAYRQFLARGNRPEAAACARWALARHCIPSAAIDLSHGRRAAAVAKLRETWNPGWRLPRWWLTWLKVVL